jgi:hypothetical protein
VTWVAVSECDWMLAGATEHLALAKATQQGLEWPPPPPATQSQSSGTTPAVNLETMLLGLPIRLRSMQVQAAQLPAHVAGLQKTLSQAPNVNSPYHAALEGQIRGLETIQREWAREIEVCERVLADATARSKTSSGESEVAG